MTDEPGTDQPSATPAGRAGGPAGPAAAVAGKPRPLFEVVSGHPSAEDVAALAVALAAKLAASERSTPSARPAAGWADRSRALRLPVAPGPDAWRRSCLPG